MTVFANLNASTIHFSRAQGAQIITKDGTKLGRLSDFFVDYEEVYPTVLAIQYKQNTQKFYISWSDIESFSLKKIVVSTESQIHRSRTYPKVFNTRVITSLLANQFTGPTVEYPALGKVVLDRQVVDTSGKKVVRVNDIHFIKIGELLRVTHAAVGMRSMFRRLGYEPYIDGVIKVFNKNAAYLKNEKLINWKYVHAIPDRSVQKNVKLSLANEDIKGMHPADLADILEDLDNNAREQLFSDLDPETAAETLSEVELDIQAQLIRSEEPKLAAQIIENMGTDEAADILGDLSSERARVIISNIKDEEIKEEISELLDYDEDTAGGLMSTEFLAARITDTKSKILQRIQEEDDDLETVYDIYVIDDEEKLLGTCHLRELLIQKEDLEIGQIMETENLLKLSPGQSWREVASYMSKYNLLNVPIIDDENVLLGIVSVDDVLPWLLDER